MIEKRKYEKETEKGSALQSIIEFLFAREFKLVPPSTVYLQSVSQEIKITFYSSFLMKLKNLESRELFNFLNLLLAR